MRFTRLARWMLLGATALACGGRLVKSEGGGDGSDGTGNSSDGQGASSMGSGAGPSRAGTSTRGGSGYQGGSPGTAGTVAVGGAIGTGGTSAVGGGCSCPKVPCPPGTQAVTNPDGCCYSCVPLCPEPVACPPIACGSGSHLEVLPGECCPTCVMDDCEAQITSYLRFRAQLLEKYATLGCMTHQDCTIYFEKNACHIGCGVVIPNAAIQFLEPNLQSFAAQTCTPGCAPIPLPCEPPGEPFCVNGLCQ